MLRINKNKKCEIIGRVRILFVLLVLFHVGNGPGFSQSKLFSVKLTYFSSSVYDEFSPVIYQDGIVFCSNRENTSLVTFQNQQESLFSLFYVDSKENGKWGKTKFFSKELTSSLNDGPAAFNKDENIICFARNMNLYQAFKDLRNSSNRIGIFMAENTDGTWSNIKPFIYNDPNFSNHAPSFSPDGNTLYFSSDRPGGYGGFDLYMSEFINNEWQDPVNLGPIINTHSNESYPFAAKSGKLYFTSNGHEGLGGEDLFYSLTIGEKWISPVHLSSEINSTADDFGLITTDDLQSGYFSSNRRNSDDIYSFSRSPIQFDTCVEQRENQYCFLFVDDNLKPNDSISAKYEWDFGIYGKISGERVKQCFPGPGKYSVILRVIDKDTRDTINIPSPYEFSLKDIEQAYISSISSGVVDESLHFDGLETNLPDVSVTEYLWDLGGGFNIQGPSMNYTFEKPGEYIIKLGVLGESKVEGFTPKVCVYKRIEIHSRNKRKKE